MRIKTLNKAFVRPGNRFLGLHYFQIVSNSGGEAILRLSERLFGQFDGTAGNLDLFGRGIKIEQGRTDFVIDAAAQIACLGASLLELGISNEDIAMHPVSSKYGDIDATHDLPGAVRIRRVDADIT